MSDHQRREKRGRRAELLAALYLRAKGYQILARRYKTKLGEIDLIARKNDTLIIVEVKARTELQTARDSISYKAQQRISKAAQIYIGRHKFAQNLGLRFDAVFIIKGWRVIHEPSLW